MPIRNYISLYMLLSHGAEYGIYANDWSSVDLQTTDMIGNYIAVYVPPAVFNPTNHITLTVAESKFKTGTAFLPGVYIQQPTTIGNYSFAGVYLNDIVGTIGIDGTDPVEFSELNNGIIGINSSLLVTNSTFKNIWRFDPSYTMPTGGVLGTGIFVKADVGKYASLTQIGLGSTISFDNNVIGIHTLRASLASGNNTMRTMSIGIVASETSLLSTDINTNDIEAFLFGITLNNSLMANRMHVEHNSMHTWGTATVWNIAGIRSNDIGEVLASDESNYFITCNTVIGNFKTGIEIYGNPFGHFYHNFTNLYYSNMTIGFGLYNCTGTKIDNNSTNGNGTTVGTSYLFSQCGAPTISNNYSVNTKYGLSFKSDNSNSRIITNNIGLHNTGLYLDGIIGQQFSVNNGVTTVYNNSWITGSPYYTSGFGAFNADGSNFSATYNQFQYDDSYISGSTKLPVFSAHAKWFFGVPSPTPATENYNDTCYVVPPPLEEDEGTNLDRLIAQDSVHTEHFDPETAQMAAAGLFDKLENNEVLRNSEDYFYDFYEANENETLGKQSKVRSAINIIYIDVNHNEAAIAFNDSTIESLLIKKSLNDSVLFSSGITETDSMAYVTSNTSLIVEVNNMIGQNNKMLKLFTDSQAIKIAFAKDLNDAISPSTTIETNEKQINDVFLRNMALGIYSLDSTDHSTLKNIGIQCPFSGGRAVYKARAYLAIIGDSLQYDDETVCAEDENYRKSNAENKFNGYVIVNPNPLKDVCRFMYKLPKDEGADLHIFDSYGNIIYHYSLPINSKSYNINLENISNGVYCYSVNSPSGLIGNGKLILIK